MRKVLAVASVGIEHKQLVLKDLKNIFKRIKISLDVLLQEENTQLDGEQNNKIEPWLKSYPYITLTIPNYEQHRDCNFVLIQILKKSTRIMFSSANSYYLFQRAILMRS